VLLFAAREGEARQFEAPALPELRLGGLDAEAAGALLVHQAGVGLSQEARERLVERNFQSGKRRRCVSGASRRISMHLLELGGELSRALTSPSAALART